MNITLEEARRVLEVVDAGLVHGIGIDTPGKMCVEAAVCYALGQPHGDQPKCVHPAVRRFKIRLNDSRWSSSTARAAGMRRIAVAQLGSADSLDARKFSVICAELTTRRIVPLALRTAAKRIPAHAERLEAAAIKCEQEGSIESVSEAKAAAAYAYAADAAAYAAADAAADAAAYAYAADAAADAAYAYAYAYAAYAAANAAANAADAYAAADAAADAYAAYADRILGISAEIGIEALRAAGSPGVALMDQLCPL